MWLNFPFEVKKKTDILQIEMVWIYFLLFSILQISFK